MPEDYSFTPVARIHSCFKEKFGTPRQSGIVSSAKGKIIFDPQFRNRDMIRGLAGFSHLWLLFLFHQSSEQGWHPTVRPPRLGGNERLGVWATRSPFRPNPIGLSSVRLEEIIEEGKDSPLLVVSGMDLVDGTPILDIKPYIPYTDSIPDARGGFAPETPLHLPVFISHAIRQEFPSDFIRLVEETLSLDPRPAYHNDPTRVYGLRLNDCNIKWQMDGERITVLSINHLQ